jgi:prepilin peptidase CpaA
MLPLVITTVFVLALVTAAVIDVRERRIPNALTVPAFALALLVAALGGWAGFGGAVAGAAIGLALGVAFMAIGAMGGGDAKLLAVVGAFLAPATFVVALAWTAVAGGALAIFVVVHRRVTAATLQRSGALLRYGATGGRSGERVTLASRGAVSVPYAVAIAIGATAAIWTRGTPW